MDENTLNQGNTLLKEIKETQEKLAALPTGDIEGEDTKIVLTLKVNDTSVSMTNKKIATEVIATMRTKLQNKLDTLMADFAAL